MVRLFRRHPPRSVSHPAIRPLLLTLIGLSVAASPGTRNEASAVSVRAFPSGEVKAPEQVRLEFSEPVVVPGAKAPPAPARVGCAGGTGVWLDDRTWAYSFETPLSGGTVCEVSLTPAFSARVEGPKSFSFHTGGPSVVSTDPWESGTLEEDQILVVTLDAPVLESSVRGRALLRIKGIASPVLLEVAGLARAQREAYFERNASAREEFAHKRLLFLRPTTRLPAGKTAVLVWDKGIQSLGGKATTAPQELTFRTRAALSLRIDCPRENARQGCVPVAPIEVILTAEIPWEIARRVRLERADAKASGTGRENVRTPAWTGPASGPAPFATVRSLRFEGPFEPGTRWRLALPPDFHDEDGRTLEPLPASAFEARVGPVPVLAKFPGRFGVVEASDPIIPVSLRALERELTLKELRVRAAAVEADPALAFRWFARLEEHGPDKGLFKPSDGIPSTRRVPSRGAPSDRDPGTFDIPESRRPDAIDIVGLPLEGKGLHLIEVQSALLGRTLFDRKTPARVATGALATDLAVHVKKGRSATVVWVTRLSTGAPVAGARVAAVDCSGEKVRRASSDASGLATIETASFGSCYGGAGNGKARAFGSGVGVVASLRDDFSFTHSEWNQGIERWRFPSEDRAGRWAPPERERPVALVLDRTLLRAGETLHASAFAWTSGLRAGARVGAPLPDTLRLRHEGSGETLTWPVTWAPAGTARVEATLPASLRKGTWSTELFYRGSRPRPKRVPGGTSDEPPGGEDEGDALDGSVAARAEVRVEDFTAPTVRFLATLPTGPVRPASGAAATDREATLHVEYLSGGVPEGRPVDVAVRVARVPSQSFDEHPGFRFATAPLLPGTRKIEEGDGEWSTPESGLPNGNTPTPDPRAMGNAPAPGMARGTLGAQGTARFEIPFEKAMATGRFVDVTLEATFDDPAGERQFAYASKSYAPASTLVGLATPSEVGPTGTTVRARVVDAKGTPVGGASVRIRAATRQSYSVRKKIFGGFYAYESYVSVAAPVAVCEARSDSRGRVSCPWKPAGGGWVLEASHTSKEGVTTFSVVDAWVHGDTPAFDPGGRSDRMDLTADKDTYAPGESARLRVAAPVVEGTALVTVEAGDVVDSFVVPYSSKSPFVTVPIRKEHAPGAVATVTLVRGRLGPQNARPAPGAIDVARPLFRFGLTHLRVTNGANALLVQVVPNAKEYPVRGRGEITVRVTTPRGGPLPGDTRVTVFAVDEALLALQENPTTAILDQLLPPRAHEVDTATGQAYLVGRRHFGLKARPPGGGGGRLGTRELFDTLLFWRAAITPDASGHVRVPFTLNDSLTRFRVFAVASSAKDRRAGSGEGGMATRQDVTTLARVPLSVRQGDVFEAGFLVRNTSRTTIRAKGTLRVDGASKPVSPESIAIAPGEEILVRATVDAPVRNVPLTLSFTLERLAEGRGAPGADDDIGGDEGRTLDAITVSVPLVEGERPRTFASSVLPVEPGTPARKAFDFGTTHGGTLALEAEAAGPGAAVRLASYLEAYPYACTEQILAKAVVRDDTAGWTSFVRELVARTAPTGLVRYFPISWGPVANGDAWLTAYVLVAAHAWKRPLPDDVVERLSSALRPYVARGKAANGKAADFPTRMLALEALVRHGVPLRPSDVDFEIDAAKLAWEDFVSLFSIAVHGRGAHPSLAARATALTDALRSRLVRSGSSLDLKAEEGLGGAQAQYIRARLIETLLIDASSVANGKGAGTRDAKGALHPPAAPEVERLLLELARAHALASSKTKEPGTLWSVWGLLANRRFHEAFPPAMGELAWEIEGATGASGAMGAAEGGNALRKGTLSVGSHPLDAKATRSSAVAERRREKAIVFPPGTGTVSLVARGAKATLDAATTGQALLFTHARTDAPIAAPEHRGLTARCSWSRKGSIEEGGVVTLSYALRAQAPQRSWVLFELPIPPGGQIVAQRSGGTDGNAQWPAFVEKGAVSVRAWYDGMRGGEATGEVDVRLGVKGAFRVPGCHAEAVQEPDVASTLPGTDFKVE